MRKYASGVILVLDRLGAGYLGPYGNTWIETPCMNRLASQSILVEHPLIDTPLLEPLYRSYWCGRHAICPGAADDRLNLAGRLRRAGITTALLTDTRTVARHALAGAFDQSIHVPPDSRPHAASRVEQTHLARLFSRAVEWLCEAQPPFLLWIHARAMDGPWDAPSELRCQLADVTDPTPSDFSEVPNRYLAHDYDPDELLGMTLAYAGQILALDQCVGALIEALGFLSCCEETLFLMTSSRGFPMGEHLRVGAAADQALYHELLQVPCMARFPDGLGAAQRSQTLWQPHHLYPTLVDWFGRDGGETMPPSLRVLATGDSAGLTQRACTVAHDQCSIRTPAWFLRIPSWSRGDAQRPGSQRPKPNDGQDCELFVKPDDRWDMNNVATRCPEIVQRMREQFVLFQQAAETASTDQLPDLPEELAECWG